MLEAEIQRAIIAYLEARGWFVEIFRGSWQQRGIPDLFLFHREHGFRWVDVKRPTKNSFTPAQQRTWPQWAEHGLGVWIMNAATDAEYAKLFGPANWPDYWKPAYGKKHQELRSIWKGLLSGAGSGLRFFFG